MCQMAQRSAVQQIWSRYLCLGHPAQAMDSAQEQAMELEALEAIFGQLEVFIGTLPTGWSDRAIGNTYKMTIVVSRNFGRMMPRVYNELPALLT